MTKELQKMTSRRGLGGRIVVQMLDHFVADVSAFAEISAALACAEAGTDEVQD